MKGKVLFCDSVSFNAKDGSVISGFRIGVQYATYKGENHCIDIWSRSSYDVGSVVRVVRRHIDGKMFVFPYEQT